MIILWLVKWSVMEQSAEGKSASGVLQDDGSHDVPSLMSVGTESLPKNHTLMLAVRSSIAWTYGNLLLFSSRRDPICGFTHPTTIVVECLSKSMVGLLNASPCI